MVRVHSRASKRPHPCRDGSQTRQRRATARHGTSTARRDGGGGDGGGLGDDTDRAAEETAQLGAAERVDG